MKIVREKQKFYCEINNDRLPENTENKHRELFNEEQDIKKEHGRNQNRDMSVKKDKQSTKNIKKDYFSQKR